MIRINSPVNIYGKMLKAPSSFDDGSGYAEIVIMGTDASVTIVVSDKVINTMNTDLGALAAIEPEISAGIDEGPNPVAPNTERFVANYVSFDNNDDNFYTTMLVKRGYTDYLYVSMKQLIRDDLVAIVGAIYTEMGGV